MLIYCISTVSGVSMPMPSYNHTGWLGGKTPGDRFLFRHWEGLFLLKCWLVSACTTVSELAVFTKARLALMSLRKSWLGSTEERSFILSTGKSRRAVVHLVDRKYWRAVFSMKTGKSGRAVLHLLAPRRWTLAAVFTVLCVTHQPVFVMNVKGWLWQSQPGCLRKVAL